MVREDAARAVDSARGSGGDGLVDWYRAGGAVERCTSLVRGLPSAVGFFALTLAVSHCYIFLLLSTMALVHLAFSIALAVAVKGGTASVVRLVVHRGLLDHLAWKSLSTVSKLQ